MVCSCCGEVGRTRVGCSCTGGKSHTCLKIPKAAPSSTASTAGAVSKATDELLDYMLQRQKIEWHKNRGDNWMDLEFPNDLITTRHSPVHTEDGFTNQLILKHVRTLLDREKPMGEVRWFVATCVCFMNPKFIDMVANRLMDGDFELM